MANKCSECARPVRDDVLDGLCPVCMVCIGLSSEALVDSTAASPMTALGAGEIARFFPELEILEFLGRGGMGAVYKVRQKDLDRVVALKVLLPTDNQDACFADWLETEAKALAKLNHPHIVTIYEFGQSDGLYYFLMEFVDGVSMRKVLKGGHMTPQETLSILSQICDALEYAHEQGIIHCDIKPENVLVSKERQVKITDFGVAKVAARRVDKAARAAAGTPRSRPAEVDPQPDRVRR